MSDSPLGPVAACTDDLQFFVVRRDHNLELWTGDRRRLQSFRALSDEGRPGDWVALSPDGQQLVEFAHNTIRMTDAATGRTRWTQQHSVLWGPPVFSPDGRWLALPEQGQIGLVDTATGRERPPIGGAEGAALDLGGYRANLDSRLGIVRRMRFSPDGRFIAASCSTTRPAYWNHAVFVVELGSGRIVGELHGHAEPVDFRWIDSEQLVTVDGDERIRVFTRGGLMRLETAPIRSRRQTIAIDPASGRVLLAGPERIAIWHYATDQVLSSTCQVREVFAAAFRDGGVELLGADGTLRQLSADGDTSRIASSRYDGMPEGMAARAAMYQLGASSTLSNPVLAALAPFRERTDQPLFRTALLYGSWRSEAGRERSLASYLHSNGWDPRDPIVSESILELAKSYSDSGMLAHAADLYAWWVRVRAGTPALSGQDSLGIELGLEISDALRALDQWETSADLVEFLAEVWPDEPRIALRLARDLIDDDPTEARRIAQDVLERLPEARAEVEELLAELGWRDQEALRRDDPARALAEAQRAVQAEPRSVDAWSLLLDTVREVAPEDLAETAAEAKRSLPDDSAEAWMIVGNAYREAGLPEEATRAFRRAEQLSGPRNDASSGDAISAAQWVRSEARREIAEIETDVEDLADHRVRIEENPRDPMDWYAYLHALSRVRRGELAEAIERARTSLDATDSRTWSTLGFAYQRLYDYRKALDCLQRAIELAGDDRPTDALEDAVEDLRRRLERGR